MYVHTMGRKTISLTDDAYEGLKAEKREGESFSDVVRRLTNSVTLEE
jgi:predicted CopG family antitoxin